MSLALLSACICNAMCRYSLEVTCLSVVKLMILGRMFALASHKYAGGNWLKVTQRLLYTAIGVANMVGLGFSVAAAVYEFNFAAESDAALSLCHARGVSLVSCVHSHLKDHSDGISPAEKVAAVQLWCESVSLVAISVSLIVVGSICARRIQTAVVQTIAKSDGTHPSPYDAEQQQVTATDCDSKKLRRDIIAVVSVVSSTFLLRFAMCAILAAANALQNDRVCKRVSACDASCKNECVSSLFRCCFFQNCNSLQLLPRAHVVHFHARSAKCHRHIIISLCAACRSDWHDHSQNFGRHAGGASELVIRGALVRFKDWLEWPLRACSRVAYDSHRFRLSSTSFLILLQDGDGDAEKAHVLAASCKQQMPEWVS